MPWLVFLFVILFGLSANADEADAVSKRLTDAKQGFLTACKTAEKELSIAIDEQFQAATADGDLKRASKLKDIKEKLEKDGLLPMDGDLSRARSDYGKQFVEARQAVEAVFDEEVSDLTKAGNLTRASAVQAEKKAWLDFVKSRKTPKSRFGVTAEQISATPWSGHRYKVFKEALSWHEAEKRCQEVGGHLLIINDKEEQDFAVDLLGRNGLPVDALHNGDWAAVWVGATDEAKESEWRWVDESALKWTNWVAGQPSSEPGCNYCVLMMHYAGAWEDRSAGASNSTPAFICEWDN